jgi:predicted RNase H-like HicB family nuclease
MKEIFLPLNVEALPGGGFLVTCVDLPGLVAQGKTEAEALAVAQSLARKLVQSYYDSGIELPPILEDIYYGENDEQWPDLPN